MPTISMFFGILIRMYFNDHPPPHFHARYNEHQAVIEIESLSLVEGSLPKRALSLVIEWATIHKVELLSDWSLCQAKQEPFQIDPLE